jgi:UDP-N-acetylglucosamine--N-acetylmuramyl-(pentapeptide) pyrophosphoryl-undecaprenol N-acetylglucosamine transferase
MLNEAVPRALYKIGSSLGGWEVVHQTGEAGILPTRDLYRKLGLRAEVVPFVHDMPRLLGGGGLAVCRAGGTTLAELAAAAVPAVLLPYPHATDDHQRRNAEVFQAAGGAVILDQRDVSGRLDDRLAGTISELMQDRSRREGMSAAMGRLGRPHAADEVADLIVQLIRPRAQMTVPASVSKAA